MPTIVIDLDQLNPRVTVVRSILQPLKRGRPVPCAMPPHQYQGGKFIAAHDGGKLGDHPRDWNFRTFAHNIWCQYFELWKPNDTHSQWSLDKAYLTLLAMNREQRKLEELICVHCDPDATDEEPLRTFKRGPHLHVVKSPLAKSHFPLNLGHLDAVLFSVDSLTSALQGAIAVLAEEVVKRYKEHL